MLTFNEKSRFIKTVIECVKDVKYIYWVKKRLVWVVLDRGERGKANETGFCLSSNIVWVVLDRGERGKANERGLKEGGNLV